MKSIRAAAVAALVVSAPAFAAPTLIGDTLSFLRAFPTVGVGYGDAIPDTTVAAGTSDQVGWMGYTTIDPEANSIGFLLGPASTYGTGPGFFDGYVVSGFDHDIASVSVLGNNTGLTIGLSNDLRSITIGLTGRYAANSAFTIGVTLADPGPQGLPEPASVALVAVALAGLALLSRAAR